MNGQDIARAALEQRGLISKYFREFWPADRGEYPKQVERAIRSALGVSKLVIWEKDVYPIAIRGYEQFEGTRLSERMTKRDMEFWYFNGFKPQIGKDAGAIAILLTPLPDDLVAGMGFYIRPDGTYGLSYSIVRMGQPITSSMSRYIAMREFMDLKLAANEPVLLPRNERRLLKKENEVPPEIRLISLRARESSGWHSGQSREYRHRWIQSGHWRKLPEPLKRNSERSGGKQGDEVIWVIPHEKGPAGAPLLKQRPTVSMVMR